MPPTERYMVLVEDRNTTTAAVVDASRDDAWRVARALREKGVRVWIMNTDGPTPTCVVADDEPLD
jgi:hypothetical protein